jgi:hypothetical protein
MAAPLTSFALNWLNRWYMKLDRVHAASIKGSPWLKRVRFENTGGEAVAQPFTLYGHRGESGDLASAQTVSGNTKNSRKLRWLVPYGTFEGSVRVPHKDIALSRKDKDAAARALQFDTDLALKQRGANIVRLWFGPAGYANGRGTFTTADSKMTFTSALEVSNFIPGDEIQISANDGSSVSHTLVASSGVGYVIARDLKAKTVTFSNVPGVPGTASNPTNWVNATQYYCFTRGTFLPGTNDMLTPLQAYLPASVATDTLHNVDRSIDSILSGYQVSDASLTGKGILQRIKRVINEHREQMGYLAEDSEIDCGYINPVEWGQAEEELASTNYRLAGGQTATEGYQYLEVQTANGSFRLISEPQVPRGVVFLLAQDDIVWHTPTGTIAEMIDEDGSIVSRMAGSNDLELRPVSYIATKMRAPFKHARLSTTV